MNTRNSADLCISWAGANQLNTVLAGTRGLNILGDMGALTINDGSYILGVNVVVQFGTYFKTCF